KEADLFCPNSVRINFTIYHQAAKNVGECLKVTAAVKNGVIEALKSIDSQQVLVLQRRPEFLVETSPQIQIIFTDLIVRC
ncbi:gamma-glutamyl-gamma-aminobutyrate hydrolase family protein, partial [Levilactobacillus parabrevis]